MGSSENSGCTNPDTGARHILVLDDELAVRKALTRLLKVLGLQCTTASVGEEMLEIIKSSDQTSTRYDLAILDIKISGGMGGIETMQKMQEMGSAIPVISMSGFATEEIFNNEEISKGFSGHLRKPFNKIELLNEIDRLCTARR